MPEARPAAYFVMGICGSGKSTIAHALGQTLGIQVLDADDFHPPSNVEKMRAGTPLTDEDRAPWLERLNQELHARLERGESVALACSALKQRYRDVLQRGLPAYYWIYLKGSRELIMERMALRIDHFMPAGLVDSQLDTLEEPRDAIVVDVARSSDEIVQSVIGRLPKMAS